MEITIVHYIMGILVFLTILLATQHTFRHSPMPSVCWILIVGLIYGVATRCPCIQLPIIKLGPNVVLFTLLPILIFDSSRNLKLTELRQVGVEAFVLATLGVVVAMLIFAGAFWIGATHFGKTVTIWDALLLGAILSPTDPVAVSAIFGTFKMPEKLKMLIEGESLLNDGTAIILFTIMSKAAIDHQTVTVEKMGISFFSSILLAIFCGIAIGLFGCLLMRLWNGLHNKFAGALLPIMISYAAFCLAQHYLHISGVITVMATTIVLVIGGHHHFSQPGKNQPKPPAFFKDFYDFCAELANGILFFFLGIEIGELYPAHQIYLVPVVVVTLLIARMAVVYAKPIALTLARKPAQWSWAHVLNIAGLKGALCIALILLLPETYPFRTTFLNIAFVIVLFTNIGNTLFMLRYLKTHTLK